MSLVFSVAACGDDTGGGGGGGGGADATSTSTSSTTSSTTASTGSASSSTSTSTSTASASSSSSDSSSSGGPEPEPGGPCESNDDCVETQYCRWDPFYNACGDDLDLAGECTDRVAECEDAGVPVCGCDGVTYDDECSAAEAGASLAPDGCEPPEGTKPCLYIFCPDADVCVEGGDVDYHRAFCVPVPEACENATCDDITEGGGGAGPCGDAMREICLESGDTSGLISNCADGTGFTIACDYDS